MKARMKNPATILPGATQAIQDLYAATKKSKLPEQTLGLVHLRASQINGCSYCVDTGVRYARMDGESDERLFAVAAWQDSPHFSDAERAALSLAEAATRLADRTEAVPDEIWAEVARHYDEEQGAALVMMIALTNYFNRINVTIRQPAGGKLPGS